MNGKEIIMSNSIQVALFGAGNRADIFLKQCKKIEVVAAFDNDSNKWGTEINGVNILPPCELDTFEFQYIVITSAYDEICSQIIEQFPYLKEKIRSIETMLERQYAYIQYLKRYNGELSGKYSLENKRMVVYTGIFGGYDNLKEPLVTEENVDYICFTDDRNLKSQSWITKYVESEQDNSAIEVRKYKCLPHRFFMDYDISFWVDASSQITAPLKPLIEQYMGTSGMLFFPHYERDCIYEEGAVNIIQHRESTAKIINQLYQYNVEKFPEHYGLLCGTYIVREHNREEVVKCMEDWYSEILSKSARDQLSLPYVMKKNEIYPDLINEHVFCNKWFQRYVHNKSMDNRK